jgi:hypothetical protein
VPTVVPAAAALRIRRGVWGITVMADFATNPPAATRCRTHRYLKLVKMREVFSKSASLSPIQRRSHDGVTPRPRGHRNCVME